MTRTTGRQSGAIYEVGIEARKVVQLVFTEGERNERTTDRGIRRSTKETRGVWGISSKTVGEDNHMCIGWWYGG